MSDPTKSTNVYNGLPSDKLEILINQYYHAMELYKHEDELNWKKLSSFMYITVGLGALLGFFINNKVNDITEYLNPLVIVAILGIIVSASYSIAIIFGVKYLQDRKNKIIEIEDTLSKTSDVAIVGVVKHKSKDSNKRKKKWYLKISPTVIVLNLFPISSFIIWVCILIALSI